jgi:signal transduction histidine kinase
MKKDEYIFLHDHLLHLTHVQRSLEPVFDSYPSKGKVIDDDRYYRAGCRVNLKYILTELAMLKLNLRELPEQGPAVQQIKFLEEMFEKYLHAGSSFYPPIISDRLIELENLCEDLKSFGNLRYHLNEIAKFNKRVRLVLNEFFLNQALELLTMAISDVEQRMLVTDSEQHASSKDVPINLTSLIKQIVDVPNIEAGYKEINFRGNFKELNVFVSGKKESLHTAFTNLFTNAVKYSGELNKYPVWIDINMTIQDKMIKTEIENWGLGIDEEELNSGALFQRGVRGRQASENGVPGYGQGLYYAQRMIESCGGSLELTSFFQRTSKKYLTTAIVYLPKYEIFE